eukprot:CAMPEP_0184660832 /NCGR_PEP_ID=MMETSP0308-20130426/35450_1 /TAXON_ID=38269 /ORGANISM="Gloeochaete witrockiana, Strain SAG 46.84" /LENGTH=584 /DNA_ID=CAMNT_0027101697 /DNA_START=172 /DNA_END=1926 /DNA_ORIENTATION=-
METNRFDELPDALVLTIFRQFTQDTLVGVLSTVCRRFRKLAFDNTLWLDCRPLSIICNCEDPKCSTALSISALSRILSHDPTSHHMECLTLHGPKPLCGVVPYTVEPEHFATRPKVPLLRPRDLLLFLTRLGSLKELRLWEMSMSIREIISLGKAICAGAPMLSAFVLQVFVLSFTRSKLDMKVFSGLTNLSTLQLEVALSNPKSSLVGVDALLVAVRSKLEALHLRLPLDAIQTVVCTPELLDPSVAPCLRELSVEVVPQDVFEEYDFPKIDSIKHLGHIWDVNLCNVNVLDSSEVVFSNIRHLILQDVRFQSPLVITNCPHLLTLTYSVMDDLYVTSCPSLMSVDLFLHWLSDDGVMAQIQECPQLLCLRAAGVASSIRGCPRLQHVEVSSIVEFDDLPVIRTLVLHGLTECLVRKCQKWSSVQTLVIGNNGLAPGHLSWRFDDYSYSVQCIPPEDVCGSSRCRFPNLKHLVLCKIRSARVLKLWDLPCLKTLYMSRPVTLADEDLISAMDYLISTGAPKLKFCYIHHHAEASVTMVRKVRDVTITCDSGNGTTPPKRYLDTRNTVVAVERLRNPSSWKSKG